MTAPTPPPARLAKLTPPAADALVPRERLFARLDALQALPMVWLAAAPGAGKTSLAASWLAARGRPTLWMQLDAADADPATFFLFLGRAAQGLDGAARTLPRFTPDDADRVEAFARRHFRALFETLPPHGTLVFDNVQDAGDALLPLLLATLLDELPPGLQVLALSRHEPPPALARARATRRLALLAADDLRCAHDEALAIAQRDGVADEALVGRIVAQTERWAAGIVLMLESVRRAGALRGAALAGGRETVFEFFATQVFASATPAVQRTLLRLSVLPRMTPALAAAISGDTTADRLLEGLARRHLFTDRRHDDDTPSFQFHALFRDFLQALAQRELGEAGHAALQARAAGLLHAAGQEADAFVLYAAGARWDEAAALVLASAETLAATGRHHTLAAWITRLPRPRLQAEPWLVYWLGVAHTGVDRSASRVELERALAAFVERADRVGQMRALTALLSGWWNEPDSLRWQEPYVQRLAALLADDTVAPPAVQAAALVALAFARLMVRPADPALRGWVQRLEAIERIEAVAPVGADALPPAVALAAGTCRLQFHWGVGDSDSADRVVRQTRPLAERADLPPGDRVWFWFWLMTHHIYRADADGAREAMERAREIHDAARRAPPFLDFERWDVTVELQLGHCAAARQKHTQLLEPQRAAASRFTQACIDLEWVRCANEEGRFDEAIERGLRAMQACREAGHDWLHVVLGLSVCCAQALAGRLDEGFATLTGLRRLSGQALPLQQASLHLFEALLHLRAGDAAQAEAALDRGLALRGGSGYTWGPGFNRPAIAELAAFALARQRHVAAMRRFVTGLHLAPPTPDAEHWPWPVRVTVLDGFALAFDAAHTPGPADGRKAAQRLLALLQALAALGGREVPAEALCDAVWPEADGDAAQRSLETGLSRLRKRLGGDAAPDLLQLRAGRVSLHPERVYVDLAAFAHRWQAWRNAPAGSAGWVAHGEGALRLYRRPLLADLPDAPWLLAERARWHRRWRDIVEALGAHFAAHGDPERQRRVRTAAAEVETRGVAPRG